MSGASDGAVALEAAVALDAEAFAQISGSSANPLVAAWRLDGAHESALREHERMALRDGRADEVVMAASLRALALSVLRERRSDAVDVARRASRMARTEATPELEYFANIVLARVRRLCGRPYLAARILSALSRYAPASWQPWIQWELVMAQGLMAPSEGLRGPAQQLAEALEASRDGDGEPWQRRMNALVAHPWPIVARDAALAMAVVDPRATCDDDDVIAWREGTTASCPDGLLGIVSSGDVGSVVFIYCGAAGPPSRCLQIGAPLMRTADTGWLDPIQRRGARVDTMLAVLALASTSGRRAADLFAEVWGFAFAKAVHSETFEVTLFRARERLGTLARIEREGEVLRLAADVPLLVPDPRCTPAADERVLQYVATHRNANARAASRALGMSLRTAQEVLKVLTDIGACERRREGRAILYAVEDTTFREPSTLS